MTTLFIDTSFIDVSIAIIKDNIILNKITKSIPNEHSIWSVSFIQEVLNNSKLKPNDIDNIMVVNGPGSFTGVRIGLTIAKTYAYLLTKDLILLSSLKILALSTKGEYILSLINANHDNYYGVLYDKNYNEIVKEKFMNINEVNDIINNYQVKMVSNSKIEIPNTEVINNIDLISVVNYYKDLKVDNIHIVTPNYLKLPQAMEEVK